MGDRMTYDRSAVMRAVKSRDTSPERAVRALLRPIAPGYRLHRADLPGKPDVAYSSRKLAIFVHGCFWHGHDCRARRAHAQGQRRLLAGQDCPQPGARRKTLAAYAAMGWRALVDLRMRTQGESCAQRAARGSPAAEVERGVEKR